MSDLVFQKSLIVPASKRDVVDEYRSVSHKDTAHERAIWGSGESMAGRFRWAIKELPWTRIRRWLDVGCGEADFFVMAEEAGHRFDQLVGVDMTPAMVERARSKRLSSSCEFIIADVEAIPATLTGFDCISLVGVLQKCGVEPYGVFAALAPRLNPGGLLFVTTKNLRWEQFNEGGLQPEASHSWFLPDELAADAERAGLTVSRRGGLLPRDALEVALTKSHECYLLLDNGASEGGQ
jgi:SAM-dependent methyltransferase